MPRTRKRAGWHPTGAWDLAGREDRASDKGRARSALRSERKPSIIFLRRQAVHPLPRGCRLARSRNFVGLPARIRVLGRLYRAPETLRGGSITVMDGRVLDIAADGSCVLAGPGAGPGRGPKRPRL